MVYLVLITFWSSFVILMGIIVFLICHIRVIGIDKSEIKDGMNAVCTNKKDGGKLWYYILCISE